MVYNKNMEPYRHIEKFKVRYCDVDFKDELKPSTVLSYLEEAACASADELGFGYAYVKGRGLAFMVTNICIEFLRPVALSDAVSVHTWPLKPSYVTFGREYQLYAGETLAANASSRWCLVDMSSGKLASSKLIDNQDYSTYNTNRVFENVRWKIPTIDTNGEEARFTIKIYNSEYDHNMHVNNTRYAEYCFNCFSIAELAEKKLRRFSISYVKQCHEGDTLRFYRKEMEEGYLVQGVNEENEIVVQAEICFE
ncbi:MAG: hypothetical protein IJX81_01550 [Clostridia bacterium]|nr:hypothetical protein [Clostridia bacterium]